jgi:hypothetical protein
VGKDGMHRDRTPAAPAKKPADHQLKRL